MKLKKKSKYIKSINLRVNDPHVKVGDHIIDSWGTETIVVRVKFGHDNEDHGTITAWQMNQLDYGADNCEHYVEFDWKRDLKVLKKAGD
jgi:hypothetical protein